MNPFSSDAEYIDVVSEEGRIVSLECQQCGTIVTEGKYWPELKLLSWKCPNGHINKPGFDMDE